MRVITRPDGIVVYQGGNGKLYKGVKTFDYNFAQVLVPADSQSNSSITIDSDADFEATYLTFMAFDVDFASQTEATRLIPPISINIQDTASAEYLFQQQVPINTVAGTAERPAALGVPRVFPSRANVTLYYTNFDQNNEYNFTLVMRGVKLIPFA